MAAESVFATTSPGTGDTLEAIEATSLEAIPEVVSRAREAQSKWAELSLEKRIKAISKVKTRILERADEIAKMVTAETGKPEAEALLGEVLASADVVPASYRTLDGIAASMQEIATAYPAIAQVVDITAAYGTPPTAEGRHLFALKISDNVATDEDEPSMLIVSAHHAREISTPVITLGAAERLTSEYATDARIAAAVNGNEIWIAPVWNPDGYNHVFTTDNLWRKNRRVFANGVGVDQNRNYPQGWNGPCAGSTSVGSETYKGPAAASEASSSSRASSIASGGTRGGGTGSSLPG